MRNSILALVGLLVLASGADAQAPPTPQTTPTPQTAPTPPPPPPLPNVDRVRIAEAFRLADSLCNRVWPDWDKAPFAVLLVTPEHEFLIRHPSPTEDFTKVGRDSVLGQDVWVRDRKLSTRLLATYPAVAGISTIVIGQAESTMVKTSTPWIITLLHEHFHQLQYSQPGYYVGVDALGLARGDKSGEWMLNYPFPYTEPKVKEQFSAMCKSLGGALRSRGQGDFAKKVASYAKAKQKFQSSLKADDYSYFAFQAWQEGIARYTEYHLAKLAAAEYQPSKEFKELADYTSFQDVANGILSAIEKGLETVELDKAQRTALYSFGAAEGLVLDGANPTWRERYFRDKFSLDNAFPQEK